MKPFTPSGSAVESATQTGDGSPEASSTGSGAAGTTSIDYTGIATRLAGKKRRFARHSRNTLKGDIPKGYNIKRLPEHLRHLAGKLT
jgi:hypothetical protein